MFELIAEGPNAEQTWKMVLDTDETYTLGRSVQANLSAPWDPYVSQHHATLRVHSTHLEVEKNPEAANSIYFLGRPVEKCDLQSGMHFVVGSTLFHVRRTLDTLVTVDERPVANVEEFTFERHELRKVRFRDADTRIDVLANLPEVIRGARVESEMYVRLANLLLAGIVHADAVAVVRSGGQGTVEILHWDRRKETSGQFSPSARLVEEALVRQRRSALHVWESQPTSPHEHYTMSSEFNWAFCTPILESSEFPWGLYVAGRLEPEVVGGKMEGFGDTFLRPDVKFTELIAEIISSVQRSNRLERQQSGLRQFFAPPILAALGDRFDTEVLEPRECDVTVLFCDLRGFSQTAEESADDLIGLLDRVSQALGVMTHEILAHGGVTGDFQGDAALGFWGWPFASKNSTFDACRAALAIRAEFERAGATEDHPLSNFKMGIGIAHGKAVAGKIGTHDQVKVTVFGPVVNLASRLEGMTKALRVPVLLDESTANIVRSQMKPTEARLRKLAKILPYGIEKSVVVSELLPPVSEMPELTDELLKIYEKGVDHFTEGRWEEAYACLHQMPASDRAQDFLNTHIVQNNRVAPEGWDGIVQLANK